MYLAQGKNGAPLLQLYKFRSKRTGTILDYREFDSRYGGQNSLVSSDMKRDFPRTKVFDDIVGRSWEMPIYI
jgi:hypothetical protein